jgi:23S rRNA pseudoU1915 N3-methylase RlmH
MLYLCASRFDLKDTEAKQLEKYFTLDEIKASKEQNPENLDKMEFDSISDNEEDEVVTKTTTCNMLIDLGVEGEDANEPQLPENGTQLRTSGRKRKHREDDDFEQY